LLRTNSIAVPAAIAVCLFAAGCSSPSPDEAKAWIQDFTFVVPATGDHAATVKMGTDLLAPSTTLDCGRFKVTLADSFWQGSKRKGASEDEKLDGFVADFEASGGSGGGARGITARRAITQGAHHGVEFLCEMRGEAKLMEVHAIRAWCVAQHFVIVDASAQKGTVTGPELLAILDAIRLQWTMEKF
jgi:hypothetical protein